jgi:hypothetical protein
MKTQLCWKTKLFRNSFEIYKDNILTGKLRKENWSWKVKGELNERQIKFETKGFFRHKTQIINIDDNFEIGQVNYHKWKAKSTIEYNNKEYKWQFDNFFRTRWSVSNENGVLIKYHSHGFNGTIISYTKDEILILTGLFIRNFLKQKSAEIAAAS